MEDNIFEVNNVSKHYPGVLALKNINLEIKRNTVHCIIGENGAGKSTFIKILTGVVEKNSGKILYNGDEYNPKNIRQAKSLGISTIFQELNTVNQLTVEQNITLGRERRKFGIITRSEEDAKLFNLLKELEPSISLKKRVSELGFAHKQIIEIAKAITDNTKVIIMDEPTASLSEKEIGRLFSIIKGLKNQNITIIYISHRLDEIFELGDYVSVFRDGNLVETKKVSEISSKSELVRMMLGKILAENYIPSNINYNYEVLKVENVSTDKLENISFSLYDGEILGFFGLVGSGKTEIASMLYGVDSLRNGSIFIGGKKILNMKTKNIIKNGISLVPEERRDQGLLLSLNIRENISIMNLKAISWYSIVNQKKEKLLATKYMKMLNIKAFSFEQKVANLSGGNQQKVVISKCLNANSNIFMMDEPTKGIDVGAKEEIHNIIRKLSNDGSSIIIFSSELPEILNLCDRIILLNNRKIVDILKNENLDKEKIMHQVTEERSIK